MVVVWVVMYMSKKHQIRMANFVFRAMQRDKDDIAEPCCSTQDSRLLFQWKAMSEEGRLQTMNDVTETGSTFPWQNPRWSADWCFVDIVNADGSCFMEIAMQLQQPRLEDFNQRDFSSGQFRVLEKSFLERYCFVELVGTSRDDRVVFKWFLDSQS